MKVDRQLDRLVRQMTRTYRKYVTFTDERHAFVCALWCAHTHLFRPDKMHGLYSTGYLAFVSPEPNCGKTSALNVTASYARGRPTIDISPTPATVFRAIGNKRNTLILDELDSIKEDNTIVNILNGGYKAGATVPRMTGNDYSKLDRFPIFCPKAFGYIRNPKSLKAILPSLETRCIRVFLKKRTSREQREAPVLYGPELLEETEETYRELAKWELENATLDLRPIFKAKELFVEDFSGREMEVWDGVLAVGRLIGRLKEAQDAAVAVVDVNRAEIQDHDNPDAQLFRDIRDNIGAMTDEWGYSNELASEFLIRMDDRPYHGTRDYDKLTVHRLAKKLSTYGLRSLRFGPANARVRRIPAGILLDVIERYIPEEED